MQVINYSFSIRTNGFNDITDISAQVLDYVYKSGIKNGNVMVHSPGSTCGLTTIEYESGVVEDLKDFFEKIAPMGKKYKHDLRWHDGNGYAHVRAAFTKSNFLFPVVDSEPILGTWQQIIFIDFDNTPRNRKIFIQIVGK